MAIDTENKFVKRLCPILIIMIMINIGEEESVL